MLRNCWRRVAMGMLGVGVAGCAVAHAQPRTGIEQAAIAAHTRVRAQHRLPPLQWSPALASVARNWATHLCSRSRGANAVLEHRPDSGYGENLHWQGGGDPPPIDAAVESWADERRFYDARTGRCRGGQCGHYTQLVWRTTTEVGCGESTCGSHHFWVCNYNPPGNWVGQRPF